MTIKHSLISGLRKFRNGLGLTICWGREQHQYVLVGRTERPSQVGGSKHYNLTYQCVSCKKQLALGYSQMGEGIVELLTPGRSGVVHIATRDADFLVSLP
jgi:hypothetical protein